MVVLSDGRHSYIHKYESNAYMLSRVNFNLKSVNFLFLFSIEMKPYFLIFACFYQALNL